MEKQNFEFAGINLEDYIKSSTNDNDSLQEKIKKITNQINKIESPLAMEKQAFQEFQKQRNSLETKLKYSILDVSFLNASNKIEYKGKEIYVPKFCIYNIDENKFSMRIYRGGSAGVGVVGCIFGDSFDAVGGAVGGAVIGGAVISVIVDREINSDCECMYEVSQTTWIEGRRTRVYSEYEIESVGYGIDLDAEKIIKLIK